MMRALRARARLAATRFRHPFRRSLEDPHAPLSLDMDRDSSTLLVAFGGMQGQLGMPPFEFFKASGDIPVKRLFIRDLRQAWYHRGLPGQGDHLEDVAAWLRELLAGNRVERLVMAGNSAGGYAALLFGALLEADIVLGFAPQTVIDLGVLAAMGDHRWDEQLRDLTAEGVIEQRFADLSFALPQARTGNTRFELYFDETFDTDRQHAERLAAVEGVELHRLQGGAHGIARDMRESGQLDLVLQRALLPGGQS
jgi:hypothetical protein